MSQNNYGNGKNLFVTPVLWYGMKLHLLWPFAFGLALILTVNSCTKTVTGPTVIDSTTIRDTLRDTLRVTLGIQQALVRFTSMFPGSTPPTIAISKAPGGIPFAYATSPLTGAYIPLRPDTSYTFYLSSSGWSGSLTIPPLGSALTTWALFLIISNNDTSMHPVWSIDSEHLTPPPPGYCYVRGIDGISDGGQYDLDLDTVYNDLVPIQIYQITRYVLVKAGVHTIFLRTVGTAETPLQKPDNFQEGSYYTIRATGSFGDNSAQLTIDQEE